MHRSTTKKPKVHNISSLGEVTPKTPFRFLGMILHPYRYRWLLFALLTSASALTWAAGPWLISRIINRLDADPTLTGSVWFLAVMFGCSHLLNELLWRSTDLYVRSFKPEMVERVRSTLFSQVLRRNHQFFADSSSGRIGHWINETTSTFSDIIDQTAWDSWRHATSLVASVFFLFSAHWTLAVLFIIWMFGLIIYNVHRGRALKKLVAQYSDEVSDVSGLVVDSVSSHEVVRALNQSKNELSQLNKKQQRIVTANRTYWLQNTVTNFVKGSSNALTNMLAVALVLLLFSRGDIALGSIVLFVAYFGSGSESVWEISWAIDQYYTQFGFIQNALDGLQGENERVSSEIADLIDGSISSPLGVEFRDLSFSYPDQLQTRVLDGINLTIEPGEKVGLVGHSGAGKSTMVQLLLALHDPSDGSLLIGEKDLANLDPGHIRSLVAYVPQEATLFNRTIRENVLCACPESSDEDIRHALQQAEALEFVQQLPNGLDTLVGERGVKLSGGQRQRLAIARAVLRDAPIFLLDEATSALDSVSEQAIQRSFATVMAERTTLVIAHRLSTLKHMDKIVVLQAGKIVEMGSHAELLSTPGVYADLWRRQKDGFIIG